MKQLNGVGAESNSMMGDMWSEKVSRSLFEYETSLEIDAAIKSGAFTMDGYKHKEGPSGQFRAVAQFIKSRNLRKVDREVFFVSQDSYDMHGEDTLHIKFREADDAITKFVKELKQQGVWDDTVILMGSDFGRSVTPNSNGGTDHVSARDVKAMYFLLLLSLTFISLCIHLIYFSFFLFRLGVVTTSCLVAVLTEARF